MLSVFMLIFQFINSQNRIIIRPQRVNQFQELLTLFGEFHVRGSDTIFLISSLLSWVIQIATGFH